MNKEAVLGVVRHILTFGGGYLVASDIIPQGEVEAAVAALVTLIGLVWSIMQKRTPGA